VFAPVAASTVLHVLLNYNLEGSFGFPLLPPCLLASEAVLKYLRYYIQLPATIRPSPPIIASEVFHQDGIPPLSAFYKLIYTSDSSHGS
jgi:hypothetical protein